MTVTRDAAGEEILKMSNPRVSFHTYARNVKAFEGVELSVGKGGQHSLVGGLLTKPLRPYTVGLLASVPRVDVASTSDEASTEGSIPDLVNPPTGCRFHPGCPRSLEKCTQWKPQTVEFAPGHLVPFFLHGE